MTRGGERPPFRFTGDFVTLGRGRRFAKTPSVTLVSDHVFETQQALEWPHVLDVLAAQAHSAPGAGLCRRLPLEETFELAQCRMQETTDMLELHHAPVPFPAVQFEDSSPALDKAEKGGVLDLNTLRALSVLIRVAAAVRRCLIVNQQTAPALFAYYASLPDLSGLRGEIDRCVSEEGDMLAQASPALAEALRVAQGLKQRIRRRVENMVASSRYRELLQEPYYAERENRYVLPVKAERQHDLPGIVHDMSASGATVFLEPRELIDLNNEIKVAELQVTREINRILQALTGLVVEHLRDLRNLLRVLPILDCIGARARLSIRMNGTPVTLNTDGHIRLWKARHPLLLLTKEQVVANDVIFERDSAVLVISGPNTGGKTVLLKLLGLYSLMARGGLHLPCGDGSEMAFFEDTFADIGDAQDLTKDLSSFSAHVRKIIGLLNGIERRAGVESPHTLVLLDEIISSTDPAEGAALAEALLRRFAELNLKVVVTTHYNSLKTLALSTPGFLNASLEFDVNTLAPTYRFIPGIPGGSSALDIAGRLGMDPSILDEALGLVHQEDRQLDHIFADLQQTHQALKEELDEVRTQRESADREAAEARTIAERLRSAEREEIRKMKKKFREELAVARAEIRRVTESLQRQNTWTHAQEAKRLVQRVEESVTQQIRISREPIPVESLEAGDIVEIANLDTPGRLLERPEGRKTVRVQVGASEMSVHVARLVGIGKGEQSLQPGLPPAQPTPRSVKPVRSHEAPPSDATARGFAGIDLRGHTAEEALEHLTAQLDQALLRNDRSVRIIHGHGTGKLKVAIREFLAQSAYVTAFRPGAQDEGGDGVTMAELT